jgi:predicted AAA+ superfamily ATPase
VILGSAAILIEKGLAESLTGRCETHYFPHWTFAECQKEFGASLVDYVRIGGYPKAYDFRDDPERLENYLQNGIIEPSLGRDILSLHAVDKPALLRQLFWYVSRLPARLVSYQKILDHLQDRGNAATITHYAELLRQAFLIVPIAKFSPTPHRTKRSIPKWLFPNPALVSPGERSAGARDFVFENLVGAHLLNLNLGRPLWQLHYWRERDYEIDFILTCEDKPVVAIEAKSGRKRPEISAALRKTIGIWNCPLITVTAQNAATFLSRTALDQIASPLSSNP